MRKTLLSSVTSLLLPFSAYGSQTGYGYQRKVDMAIGSEMLHESSLRTLQIRTPERVEADELVVAKGSAVRELVLVDANIRDKHLILKQVKPGLDIVEIDNANGGVEALIHALKGYRNLQAVHIVAHAEAGVMHLGGHQIDKETLLENFPAFAAINQAVREGGDLLLYGCNLAQGKAGEDFLDVIKNNTHVDVAASVDKTGNEIVGANWDLEIRKGDIETALLADSIALKDFSYVLAAPVGVKNFSSGWTDSGNTLVSTHFIVGAKDAISSNPLDAAIYAAPPNPAYIQNGESVNSYFYVNADGVDTGTFELTGLTSGEYLTGQFTNVYIVGILPDNSTITSSTLNGNGSTSNESFDFGAGELSNFSGVQIKGFKLYFDANALGSVPFFEFRSFTTGAAQNPAPAITSATYDASAGVLSVTGANFSAAGGAANDVVANKFTLAAEGGSTYTLTDTSNVEISSATSFTLTLSTTDRAAVNLILNKNGASSTGGTTYNLAGAAGFIAASAATSDATGNGVTVSNVAVPTITSSTYDANTGVLVVTGSGLLKLNGATNDINANKFTFTGQGGSTWTLTDTANVEITSGTSFSLTLSATDKTGINAILNNNGISSAGGTTYNLAAAEDWAAGADAAVVVADTAGNAITVSNVISNPVPQETTFFGNADYYSDESAAGSAGFAVENIVGSGWDFTVFSNNDLVDAAINVEAFTGETHLAYGASNAGETAIIGIQLKSNTYKYFDLQSVDVTIDGANGTNDDTEIPMQLVGYKNGAPVAGATLIQNVINASGGGLLVTFDVSSNAAFIGIDSFQVETTGSDVTYAMGVDNIVAENFRDATLADSPMLIFTSNSADITGDDVASDGEGGAVVITDIDIEIFNISDTDGTPTGVLSWEDNSFLFSSEGAFSALTYNDGANGGTKGMAIKSADGSEFQLEQFSYYNWGETESATISIVGYRDSGQVASTTFEGYDAESDPQIVTFDSAFSNVDDIRIFISGGGHLGDQSESNHSINNIQVSPANPNASPTFTNLTSDSVAWAGVGNTVALDSGGDASLSDAELEALNSASGDWNGASLTVQRNGTAVPEDIFGFDTSGAFFEVSGGNLQSGGLTFATFTNTNGVLTISFTSSGTTATTALVNDVAQRITYRNDTPAGEATIRFTLSDGTDSTTADVTVTSDTIYVTNTSDVSTVDPSNGTGLREALIIAANDGTGTQTIVFASSLAGQTIALGSGLTVFETISLDADAASGMTISGSSVDFNPGTTVTFINGTGDSMTISSVVGGSGSLVKSGVGTLTLSGTNTYSGSTTLAGGTLSVADDSNVGSGSVSLAGGTTLAVTGATNIDNAIALSGDATVNNSAPLTLSGVISGASSLTKSGAGTLTLSGTNTYSGSTSVSAGTLSIAGDSNLGSGTLNLSSGGLSVTGATTIDNSISLAGSGSITNANAVTLAGVISGAGNLGKSGAGTLTLSGTNTYTGTTSVGAGALSVGSDSNLGAGSLSLGAGSTLSVTGATTVDNAIALSGDATVDNADALTLSGVISGSFGLTKTGAANLTLSGANTYTGATTVSAGSLSVAGDSNFGGGSIGLAAGTTLAITGAGTIDNAITLTGNAVINNSADVTLSGVLSGGFSLQKSGAASLTLSGTNTQTGTLDVSAGSLQVTGSTSSATTVASGATLGGTGTLGGNVAIQSGGTLSPGSSPGTLTINGDLTLDSGGILAVEINGTTAGTGYDQIIVTGAVDVTGATLSATHGYVPGNGDSYTIISNDLTDAITGTFTGLAEGGTLTAGGNGTVLTASYVGDTGNDFTLTAPINVAPVIGDLGGDSVTFTQGVGPVLLDDPTEAATVTDADSPDFNNGTLVVSIVLAGVPAEDVLAINDQGAGAGEIGVSGTDVTYEGATIGSFTGGTGGDNLEITFDGNANAAAVQALVRNLTYSNTNATNNISQLARTVRVTLSDGDGGTSSNADVSVEVIETVAPTVVSMVVADTALAVGETSTVTITFSEAVTNLEIADFTVANGALSSLASGDGGITWTATLTPTAATQDPSNLITLDNTAYTDLVGNAGTGTSDSNNYAIDTLRPGATVVVTDTALIAGETSLITITFNEAVSGLANADLTIANGTLSTLTSSDGGITWTATYTPTAGVEDATNVITLDNTGVVDAAGNAGSGTTDSNNYAIDTLPPTASLVVTDTTLLDGETTTLTITFSEAVGGLDLADLVAENASLTSLSTANNITWTATLTPDAGVDDVTNVVTLASTGVVDVSGNPGAGTTNSNNYAIDSTVPTVASVSVPANGTYVAGDTLTFTVNTSEAVTVVTTGGMPSLSLTLGSSTRDASYVGGSGTSALTFSYTVGSGDLDSNGITLGSLTSNGATMRDAAGNNLTLTLNAVGSTAGVLVDAVVPTLASLNPADDALEVLPSANLVITLSEDIALGTGTIVIYDSANTPFAVIDVADHDGQLSIDGAALTVDLTDDLLESTGYYVLIADTAITDLAGNAYGGIADPTGWSFEVADITPPVVAVIALDGAPAPADASVDFLVVFDENANALTSDDFELTSTGTADGTIDSVSAEAGSTVTVTVNGITGTGSLRLDLVANSDITDDSGNGNNTNGYLAAFTDGEVHTVDRDAPAMPAAPDLAAASDSGGSDDDNITNVITPTFTGTAEANATVTVISDVDGNLGNSAADGSGSWTLTPGAALTEGAHVIHVSAEDAAGNVSQPSADLALQLDTTTPSGHSVSFDTSVYNAATGSASFTFAGAEIGTTYSYTISSSGGGTPVTGSGSFATATDQVADVNLAGLADGTLTLSVTVTDTAGNAATAVTATAQKDVALPNGHSVAFTDTSLNAAEAGSTGFSFSGGEVGASYTYTVTSSGGGTSVTGSGTLATATDAVTGIDLSGLADGTLTLSVVLVDNAGNTAPAVTDSAALDQTAPTVAITSAAANPFNGAFAATITFSEAVTGFAMGDITAGNATLSNFADNGGGSYSVTVTPMADGNVTLDIVGAVAQDAVGNNNSAATGFSLAYDGSAPTPVLTTSASDPTNEAFTVNIVFGESVSGFAIADITSANATLSSLVNNGGGSYSVTVTPVTDGTVTLDVAAGVAEDSAGNANLAADQLSLVYDTAVPAPTITSSEPDPTNSASFPVAIAFGETVSGFAAGDITVANATLSGFTDNGGGNYGVTVTPTADGAVNLSLAAGVAQDAAANDNLTASFSLTYDGTAPTLASSNPVDGATNVAFDTDLTLTFSEAVAAGSGNITLYAAADDSAVEAFDVTSLALVGNAVTVELTSPLTPTRSYYLQIADTAFVDAAGNAYAGIADETTLNFTVANSAPVANADTDVLAEDTGVDISVLSNDTDSDSSLNAASVTVIDAPQHGTTSVNTANGVITYTAAANYNGADTFTYTVEDIYSGVSNVAVVGVTVTPVNDAPVAVADIANTPEDNAVSIDVAANDTDVDSADATPDSLDTASITIVSAPAHGTASVVDGEVLYTPNLDYNGSDSFTYTIDDAGGATSNVATVLVNVTGINDLPTAVADTATVAEDGSVDIDVLGNDSDLDGSLEAASVAVLTAAGHGTTSVDALTGVITYAPAANYHGTDSFTYVVEDDAGGSATASVTVTVTSVNDVPVANADTAVLAEDVAHTINVLGNDQDIDGVLVPASVEIVTAAQNGTTSVNTATGAIVYTPGENFNGSDSFSYRVRDDQGGWSAPATVTITVEDVNDQPLANNDTVTTDEDTAVTIDLLANDSDVDGTLDPASLVLSQPASGSVTDNGDGTVRYQPEANFFGVDSFTYTVADDDGGISNSAVVTITIDPLNDAPTISGEPATTVAQDAAYGFTPAASDVDPNTTLTFSIVNQPSWMSFNAATGALAGTPENDDVGDYDDIVITVSDGLLSDSLPAFTITVTNVNDPPVISGAPVGTVNQDGSYSFVPTVVDVDANTTLSFSVTNLPHWASFNPSTGAITGTPANSDVGTYNDIVISVSDGITTTMLGSFDITVANVNDAPTINADRYSVDEGGLLQPDAANGVLVNDSDIDGDNLVAVLVNGPRNASEFSLSENGSFRYRHNGTETRSDSFTYRVSDGTVNSPPVTVSINVAAVNDAPVFVTQPLLAITEGGTYGYDVGVTDVDSVVQLSLQEGPPWLSLTGSRLSGTAPVDQLGAVPVVLRATDGEYTVDQTYDLTVLEREASLVTISTNWRGLPSVVDNTVDLQITLTHTTGPAVPGASLQVSLQGLDSAATMANCTRTNQVFSCPLSLATGASTGFRLRVTPEEAGNLVVLLRLTSAGEPLASAITDVSVTERAVSQGNITFNLANATALASINLLNDGTRELVAGTSLGDTVKLLNYTLTSGSAQVLGEIGNRGYTERVRVADIDQDGLEDILVVNRSGDASAVYYDRGDEFVVEAGSVTLPHGREALLRDLNDDGYPELILGAGGFNLYIYENNEGVFDIAPLVFTSPASIVHFALLRRLPADAPLEGTLVISSASAVQLVRFGLDPDSVAKPGEGEGAAAVSEKFTLLQEVPLSGVSTVQLVDVDGDGREEIIASSTHQNNTAETSGVTIIGITDDDQLQPIARLGAASAKKVEVADFNGDGLPDLLVANDNNSYQFYRGSGDPASWTLTNTILYHSSTLVIPEDVNNDGLADVLIYEDGDEQVELYLSAPDGDTGETADLTLSATTRVVRNDRYHFEYAINVMNEGISVAQHPRVIVPLPDGVDAVNLPEYCVEDEEVDEVTCNLQDLAPGAGQVISLILAGDWRINNLSITAQTTSDALETDMADNTATTSLGGMFEYKRARIKGGGGSVNFLWFGALMGLALARRRREQPAGAANRKVLSVVLPLAMAAGLMDARTTEAASSNPNSYVEGSVGMISSDWDMMTFYYDLSGSTQEAVLTEKDDQRFGWQLLYGYRIHSRIALEVGYLDSGQTELEVETVVSETDALRQVLIDHAPVAGDGPYTGLRFSLVDRDEHELFAKLGLWSWSAGYTLTLGDQAEWVKRSGEDWLIGLGFSVPVLERFDLGGSIQTTAMDDDRLIFLGINLAYRFDVGR